MAKKKSSKRNAQKVSKIIGSIVILLFFSFIAQAYLLPPEKVFGKIPLNYLPLPAAIINSDYITLAGYFKRYEIAKKVETNPDKQIIIDQLVENKIIELTANNKNIEVSSEDLDRGYVDLQKISGKKDLGAEYQLSEEEFKKLILLPSLRRTALQVWLASNKKLNESAYKKLEAAKQKLEDKRSFAVVAQEYSEDAKSAQIGGDMGFVSRTDLVPEVFNQLEKIDDKDAHVLVSRFGIHLIQIMNKDSKGPEGSQRYRLKQVFFQTTDFSKWFEKQENYFSVLKFVG